MEQVATSVSAPQHQRAWERLLRSRDCSAGSAAAASATRTAPLYAAAAAACLPALSSALPAAFSACTTPDFANLLLSTTVRTERLIGLQCLQNLRFRFAASTTVGSGRLTGEAQAKAPWRTRTFCCSSSSMGACAPVLGVALLGASVSCVGVPGACAAWACEGVRASAWRSGAGVLSFSGKCGVIAGGA